MNDVPHEEAIPADQPIEIEDEYTLALESSGVDDDALREQPGDIKFSITSYGADYTVDGLLQRLKSDSFYVPPFQRRFVWSQRHASRFMESLLMGLPVPGIFLYKEPVTNRHLVVDGQQRLRTLQFFYNGTFLEKKFRLVGVRDEWNNKSYSELSASDRMKLDDCTIHATIFQQDEPKDKQKSLHFVFERINSGGIRLSPQEIRNCINNGPLLDAISSMNDHPSWRSVFGKQRNTRLKDQELILRFLAMHERYETYSRPMRDFLNDFAADLCDAKTVELDRLRATFSSAIDACWKAKGKDAFRPNRSLNAAVFEAVMLGVAARLKQDSDMPDIAEIKASYDQLVSNKEFLRACERATADEETVKLRRNLSVEAFKRP